MTTLCQHRTCHRYFSGATRQLRLWRTERSRSAISAAHPPPRTSSYRRSRRWRHTVCILAAISYYLMSCSCLSNFGRSACGLAIVDQQQNDERNFRSFIDHSDWIQAKPVEEEIQQERRRG